MKVDITGLALLRLAVLQLGLTAIAVGEAIEIEVSELSATSVTQVRRLSELKYSASRRQFAFVVSKSVDAAGGAQSIWIHDTADKSTRALTDPEGQSSHPRWCPDARCLTYLADDDDTTQIFNLPMNGGEPEAITSSDASVNSFEWAPQGGSLAFIANESAADAAAEKEELLEVVTASSQQVWLLDTGKGQVSQLTSGRWRISALHWAPDGETLFLAASADVDSEIEYDRIYAINIQSSEMTEILKPNREFGQISVSPDGAMLGFVAARDQGPETFDLFTIPVAGGTEQNLTANSLDRKVQQFAWVADNKLIATVQNGFETPMYEVYVDGSVQAMPRLPANPGYSLVATKSVIAFLGSTYVDPEELWVSYAGEQFGQATNINDFTVAANSPLVPSIIRYKSFDGQEIDAALLMPQTDNADKPLPLVVLVHGGPSSRWANQFDLSWGALLLGKGYAVLKPNIRGSTGYSYDFLMSNIKDLGGGDFKDVMAGVDHLIAAGVTDPDRVGIAGWSYGGYMAAWAVTQTDRFKVAVSGAPVTNWLTEYGTEVSSINRYDRSLLGAPYDDPDLYLSVSPVTGVRNVSTPVLLICADNDVIDPIAQCWEYHRGLQQNGVENEYVIYKDVGHSRSSWSNAQRHDSMNRMISWIQKYL